MIETLGGFDPTALGRFDAVIDVRSPAEFADDHIPGSINLPVLEDDERAEVGTIYVQESRLKARRIGAALVARNIGRHLEGPLSDKSGSFMPLIYCWRGGQRSARSPGCGQTRACGGRSRSGVVGDRAESP